MLTPGLFHAQPRRLRFGVQPADFFAFSGKLQLDSLQLCARLVEKMGRRDQGDVYKRQVKIGSGNRSDSRSPEGSSMPQILPLF